ncbi:heavy-metal-associated domain-containing protein [candidate division KSB1 bacterium]|nr:heavy-metal-associated domain-containing protein [candidate division KSB1 bacterium]
MLKVSIIAALLFLLNGSIAFAQTESEADTSVAVSSQKENIVEVRVDGLSCPFCVYGLEKKMKKIDGILDLKIDFEKGLVTFSLKEGKSVDEKTIVKIVKESGFTAKEIKFSKLPKERGK